MLTKLRAGALAFAFSSNLSKSGMPEAARVASGPGENRVHANAPWTKRGGHVSHRTLQRSFRNSHDVVILHHRLAAIVRHREKSAALFATLGKLGSTIARTLARQCVMIDLKSWIASQAKNVRY
jgi:hypothetical protein